MCFNCWALAAGAGSSVCSTAPPLASPPATATAASASAADQRTASSRRAAAALHLSFLPEGPMPQGGSMPPLPRPRPAATWAAGAESSSTSGSWSGGAGAGCCEHRSSRTFRGDRLGLFGRGQSPPCTGALQVSVPKSLLPSPAEHLPVSPDARSLMYLNPIHSPVLPIRRVTLTQEPSNQAKP